MTLSHLISHRIPNVIGHPSLSIPALIGLEMAPQVAQPVQLLPVAAPASQHLIRARIWAGLFTGNAPVCALSSDIWWIYVGILRPLASWSCGGKIKCHNIWARPVSWSYRSKSTSSLRHDLNWTVSTCGGSSNKTSGQRLKFCGIGLYLENVSNIPWQMT